MRKGAFGSASKCAILKKKKKKKTGEQSQKNEEINQNNVSNISTIRKFTQCTHRIAQQHARPQMRLQNQSSYHLVTPAGNAVSVKLCNHTSTADRRR
jgi:hypothetical protein